MLDILSTDFELPGSKLNMKTKRESWKSIGGVGESRRINCRFGRPACFQVPFKVRTKTETRKTAMQPLIRKVTHV